MFATRKDITKHRKIIEITGWFSEITEAILLGSVGPVITFQDKQDRKENSNVL